MPIEHWEKTLPDGRTVIYEKEEELDLVQATARVRGTALVYTHSGISGPMSREEIEAEFAELLTRR